MTVPVAMPARICSVALEFVWSFATASTSCGAHPLFCVVLLRARIAEVGEYSIAHEARDHAVMPLDHLADACVIRGDHAPHVFLLRLPRKRRRPKQFAEHDRQMTSLGIALRRRFGCRLCAFRRRCLEFGDGGKHLAAMPKRNAEFL